MKINYRVSQVVFIIAGVLVVAGYQLQKWALENSSQIWINLSPDIMGAGVLVFAVGVVIWVIGRMKKISW